MKKYILKSLFVSMLCMLAASCQDTDEFAQLDSRKAQVMFSVAMDSPSARSRANWNEGQYTPSELGNAYDNHIDLNQFVVKIEAGGKNYELKDIIKWKVEAENKDEVSNEYKFVGVVEGVNKQTELEEVKISVFANMGSNAENLTFNQDAKNIPMWGVYTEDKLVLKPGVRQDVGAIYLLRAMAKIEVGISDDMVDDGYSLNSVKLKKYNFIGNSLLENYATYANTSEIDTETKNVNASDSRENLAFTPAEAGKKYIVYLPEVNNVDGNELKLILTLQKEGEEYIETELVVKDYTGNTDNTGLIDIVRNHWYKYVISGIVNGNPTVEYSVVPWTGVDIEVGGEKFLVLNKDVIEIYNSNIDADQLKFSSSSPIKSITLKDIYGHNDNGTFTEGATDNLSAYYVTKFGQKIQLGDDPGFPIDDKKNILDREKEILNAITATAEEGKLDGGITITSPYINHETYGDSHYDTPRYLEFEVENAQGLTASFRVVQYPPVVITNEEGYFSYRSDQKFSEDQKEASHYHNYMGWKSFHLTGLMWGYEWDWTNNPNPQDEDFYVGNTSRDYSFVIDNPDNVVQNALCEVIHYGNWGAPHTFIDSRPESVTYRYGGIYKSTTYPTESFFRHRYYQFPGGQTTGKYIKNGYSISSKIYDHPRGDVQGLAIGPYYERDSRTYRKQFVWNIQPIFYNLYVSKVYDQDENGKLKGQAVINSMTSSVTVNPGVMDGEWVTWGTQKFSNHRMYTIRTTTVSADYNLGYPTLTDEGVTENTMSNANMVSPQIAVASQLGETFYQSIITLAANYNYKVPVVGKFYQFAVEHCREYVETSYKDENGNHKWDEGEEVTHYKDWRLPTKAEIDLIIKLQDESRAMDKLLTGQYYFCAAGGGDDADINVKENWVSNEYLGYDKANKMTGYYIRCVRDIK